MDGRDQMSSDMATGIRIRRKEYKILTTKLPMQTKKQQLLLGMIRLKPMIPLTSVKMFRRRPFPLVECILPTLCAGGGELFRTGCMGWHDVRVGDAAPAVDGSYGTRRRVQSEEAVEEG